MCGVESERHAAESTDHGRLQSTDVLLSPRLLRPPPLVTTTLKSPYNISCGPTPRNIFSSRNQSACLKLVSSDVSCKLSRRLSRCTKSTKSNRLCSHQFTYSVCGSSSLCWSRRLQQFDQSKGQSKSYTRQCESRCDPIPNIRPYIVRDIAQNIPGT